MSKLHTYKCETLNKINYHETKGQYLIYLYNDIKIYVYEFSKIQHF